MTIPLGQPSGAHVELVPLTVTLAKRLLEGAAIGLALGEGWPHEDSATALALAARDVGALVWLVVVAGLVVGDCGTHGLPDQLGAVEVGYGLAAPARGRGIGRVVVRTLLDRLAANGVRRVVAHTRPDNLASRRVLEVNGFHLIGDVSGFCRYEREL